MLWLQIFIGGFLVVFGLFVLVLGLASSAAIVLVWVALFFFALAAFVIVNMLGFRSQFVIFRDDGISFRLAPIGNVLVLPWKLCTGDVPWSGVRSVDVKLRNLGGAQRIYVLRTTAGDVAFFWPQWRNAEAIAQEIIRRSGATTGTEDMNLPAAVGPNQPPIPLSAGERFMRGFGTAMLIVSAVLGLLCVIAILGSKAEDHWSIGKAFIFLGIAAVIAQGMRRYRRIR